MTLLWSILSGAVGSLGEWLADAPAWVWGCIGAFAVGFALGAWGGDDAQNHSVYMTYAEQVDFSDLQASVFTILLRHEAPDSTVTRETTLPAWIFEDHGSGNAIGEVTYDSSLPSSVRLPNVPYMTIPLVGGTRPAIEVGSDRVSVTLGHPETGRPYSYEYDVPNDNWKVDIEGEVFAGVNLEDRGLDMVGSKVTAGLSHSRGQWAFRASGGVATYITESEIRPLGVGGIGVSYTIASW